MKQKKKKIKLKPFTWTFVDGYYRAFRDDIWFKFDDFYSFICPYCKEKINGKENLYARIIGKENRKSDVWCHKKCGNIFMLSREKFS